MIVVTGAAGLTGSAIVRRLADRGHDVVAITRQPRRVEGADETYVGDCRDRALMAPLIERADMLIHGAGILYGREMSGLPGLARLRHMVVLSSAGIYSRYRMSVEAYRDGEEALRRVARVTLLRPTMIYGSSRDRNLHHLLCFASRYRFLPLLGDGRSLVQPIHYEDLATAAVALTEREPLDSHVDAGGQPLALREMLETVFIALDRRARIVRLPIAPAITVARLLDALGDRRLEEKVSRMTEDRAVDNGRLSELTGVQPRLLEIGLRAQVAEMRAEGLIRG